jgi:Protein of unknown function (DUF4232)
MRAFPISAVAALVVFLLPFTGCSGNGRASTKVLAAPALITEQPHSRQAPANPNAPYVVLQKRSNTAPVAQNTTVPSQDVPLCSPANLAVSEIASNTNASERTVSIAFTNKGDSACQLGGYPSVSFPAEEQSALQSLTVLHDLDAATQTVLLPPKGAASFSLRWITGQDCPSISKLLVTAPGTTHSFSLNRPVSPCQGRIEVTAIRAVPKNG